MTFEIIKKDSASHARAGILHTAHGPIETPVFMPVGTQGTVKGVTSKQLIDDTHSQIILGNTYHLSLRPGIERIKAFGGLHEFIGWPKPILTDSGGFQVFSLSKSRRITPDGVIFKSHIDGSTHQFTPKNVIDKQRAFNSDIMMPLDICTPYPATKAQCDHDVDITSQWEIEAFQHWEAMNRPNQLFAIIQGGMFTDLRNKSVDSLSSYDFSGFAIGGVSVGEPTEHMYPIIAHTAPQLPETKARYLMGVGMPDNLRYAISQGIDMFDCVLPTRLARHGQVFIPNGRLSIKKEVFKTDHSPIDITCPCYTCTHTSRAYLRHLFIAGEMLSATLMSIHNIHFLNQLVRSIRNKILN